MVEISALIELLMEKGIITKDELMEKCKKLGGEDSREVGNSIMDNQREGSQEDSENGRFQS